MIAWLVAGGLSVGPFVPDLPAALPVLPVLLPALLVLLPVLVVMGVRHCDLAVWYGT